MIKTIKFSDIECSEMDVEMSYTAIDDFDIDVSEIIEGGVSGESYTGRYRVMPSFEVQKLPTTGKVMSDDVTVLDIQTIYTSNKSGGLTLYI